MRAAHRIRDRGGFTIIEMMIVVALMGIVAAVSIPLTARYRVSADTRKFSHDVMAAVSYAHELSTTFGQPVWIVFEDPYNNTELPDGVFARVHRDVDLSSQAPGLNFTVTAGDVVRDFEIDPGLNSSVTFYGLPGTESPFQTTVLPAEDQSPLGQAASELKDLLSGTSLPEETIETELRGIFFDTQGLATDFNGGAPGTGAGGIYITDNNRRVYAVIVEPLGNVTLRTLDAEAGTWN